MALFTVVSHHGIAVLLENSEGKRHLFPVGRSLKVVVGDWIEQTDTETKVLPRKNVLRRKATVSLSQRTKWGEPAGAASRATANKKSGSKHAAIDDGPTKIIAANLDLAAVVVAAMPQTPILLIDKIIVACRLESIEPCIVVNKCDLPESPSLLNALRKIFGNELKVFGVTANPKPAGNNGSGSSNDTLTNNELDLLKAHLAVSGRSIFVGVSGSGKSSLTNTLLGSKPGDSSNPAAKTHATIGALAAGGRHGAHTTASSMLYHLPSGGDLIDCPGIRDFKPVELSPLAVATHFVGFAALLKKPCAFRSCLHEKEPGCSVLAGVKNGSLAKERYEDYLKLQAVAR